MKVCVRIIQVPLILYNGQSKLISVTGRTPISDRSFVDDLKLPPPIIREMRSSGLLRLLPTDDGKKFPTTRCVITQKGAILCSGTEVFLFSP